MMLSFLATQGFAIMYYGGAGWQFGKRKVSGMSNEQVNKMSPNDFLMRLHSETKTMVPTMAQGMQDMTPLVKTTLVLFGAYIREAIKAFPEVVQNILGSTDSGEFSNIPTSSGSSGNLPPQMASFLHYFATLSKATQGQIVQQAESPSDFTIEKQKRLDALRIQSQMNASAKLVSSQKLISPQLSLQQQSRFQASRTGARQLRKAGQSQILERAKLIAVISRQGKQVRAGDSRKRHALKYNQQLLVNLLARYRF